MDIPGRLISEIKAGECVAFVGAGFSAPVVPEWSRLLLSLAEADGIEQHVCDQVVRLVKDGTSKDLEAAAQVLSDALDTPTFTKALQEVVGTHDADERMAPRLEALRGIPFRAVLTTNFDGILRGSQPGRDAYLDVLRPSGHRWWDQRYWASDPAHGGPAIVNLHGNLQDADEHEVVFTRQDYRRRVYRSPGYVTFLRSVMATTTVLYLGFSFTDAYLDEVRSEILALLRHQKSDQPIAYALLSDAKPEQIAYAKDHEGLEVISYSSADDHSEFDQCLEAIHRQTNPTIVLGSLLESKTIIWIDPDAQAVDHGLRFLERAVELAGGSSIIRRFDDADEALRAASAQGADLIVTRWGHGQRPDGRATAEHVLSEIRQQNIASPAVVFASGDHGDENKVRSLKLGATAFEHSWEGLFREIERIFLPGGHG